jgi:hypothetical protein
MIGNECVRLCCQLVGQIARHRRRPVVVIQILRVVVVVTAAHEAPELIEAVLVGMELWPEAEMPFPDERCRIASPLQQSRQRRL